MADIQKPADVSKVEQAYAKDGSSDIGSSNRALAAAVRAGGRVAELTAMVLSGGAGTNSGQPGGTK